MKLIVAIGVTALWSLHIPVLAQSTANKSGSSSASNDVVCLLQLVAADDLTTIAIQATVGGLAFRDHWEQSVQAIFEFADFNRNQRIDANELRLLPSARAISYSATSGFTPPIDAVTSVSQLVGGDANDCSLAELQRYYREHSIGTVSIATGPLRSSETVQCALIGSLDADGDRTISGKEWMATDSLLKKLDTNDDELISAGELVPGLPYPGCAATRPLKPEQRTLLDMSGAPRLSLENRVHSLEQFSQACRWRVSVADDRVAVNGDVIRVPSCYVDVWASGDQVTRGLAHAMTAIREALKQSENVEPADRRQSADVSWLIHVADRDLDGLLEESELVRWEQLQRQIVRGQVSASILYGGGLFEMLDSNHDAALSIRELRTAPQVLRSQQCLGEHDRLLVDRIPNVVLVTFNAGGGKSMDQPSKLAPEWFRSMDRNDDGDISDREFTGSIETFRKLDRDHDQLISPAEAEFDSDNK